jgi:hypothetical protein
VTEKAKKGGNAKDHPSTPSTALNELLLSHFIAQAHTEQGNNLTRLRPTRIFFRRTEVAFNPPEQMEILKKR